MKNNESITQLEVESKLDILVDGQTNNSRQLQDIRNDLQNIIVCITVLMWTCDTMLNSGLNVGLSHVLESKNSSEV